MRRHIAVGLCALLACRDDGFAPNAAESELHEATGGDVLVLEGINRDAGVITQHLSYAATLPIVTDKAFVRSSPWYRLSGPSNGEDLLVRWDLDSPLYRLQLPSKRLFNGSDLGVIRDDGLPAWSWSPSGEQVAYQTKDALFLRNDRDGSVPLDESGTVDWLDEDSFLLVTDHSVSRTGPSGDVAWTNDYDYGRVSHTKSRVLVSTKYAAPGACLFDLDEGDEIACGGDVVTEVVPYGNAFIARAGKDMVVIEPDGHKRILADDVTNARVSGDWLTYWRGNLPSAVRIDGTERHRLLDPTMVNSVNSYGPPRLFLHPKGTQFALHDGNGLTLFGPDGAQKPVLKNTANWNVIGWIDDDFVYAVDWIATPSLYELHAKTLTTDVVFAVADEVLVRDAGPRALLRFGSDIYVLDSTTVAEPPEEEPPPVDAGAPAPQAVPEATVPPPETPSATPQPLPATRPSACAVSAGKHEVPTVALALLGLAALSGVRRSRRGARR